MNKSSIFLLFIFFAQTCIMPAQGQTNKANKIDFFRSLEPGSIKIGGHLGHKIDQCITNRILAQPTEPMLKIFQEKNLNPGGYWGEFFGKWAAAAGLAHSYGHNNTLLQKMESASRQIMESKDADGYISTYLKKDEFTVWDIWIQKYVLLGLIAQYDATGRKEYLNAARKSADYLISKTGPGKMSLEEYGPPFHKGGVNFSILEPIVLLYQRSSDKKYLDYGKYIIDAWSKPGKYSPDGIKLIEIALADRPPVDYDVRHAYALMSDFEGVAEMYRSTGNRKYLDACVKLGKAIEKYELMITGTMGNNEMWSNTAYVQTSVLEHPNETCTTATWIKLCYQLLRLTGDPHWADEMEKALYNGLLGAMTPNGEWWSYDSHIYGERVPSRVQGLDLSCCVSNGPRALLLTPSWFAMQSSLGGYPVLNLYAPGSADFKLNDDRKVTLTQTTAYPEEGTVDIKVNVDKPSLFPIKLRIPAWSKQTSATVNGTPLSVSSGGYLTINRTWKNNDVIHLTFDMRGRIVQESYGTEQAIVRGPIVLAMDSRLLPEQDTTVWLLPTPHVFEKFPGDARYQFIRPKNDVPKKNEERFITLNRVVPIDKNIWMAFEIPFVTRAVFHVHREKKIVMCDFASAGNEWSDKNFYRVWLPQPLYLGNMYAKNTWRFASYGIKKRTEIPESVRKAAVTTNTKEQ